MKLKNIIKLFNVGLVVFMMVGCGETSSTNTIITSIPVLEPVSVEWCPEPLE